MIAQLLFAILEIVGRARDEDEWTLGLGSCTLPRATVRQRGEPGQLVRDLIAQVVDAPDEFGLGAVGLAEWSSRADVSIFDKERETCEVSEVARRLFARHVQVPDDEDTSLGDSVPGYLEEGVALPRAPLRVQIRRET